MSGAENAEGKQRGRPFKPGQSGNPKGKPKGTRHKATMAVEALLDGEAEQLTRKAIDAALSGDMTALRLCLERVCPPRKSRPVSFDLPEIEKATDILTGINGVMQAVANGDLTPEEGQSITAMLEQSRRAQELVDLDERLSRLEENQK